MRPPSFIKLNMGWNAEPNAPDPRVAVIDCDVTLRFLLSTFQFPHFADGDIGILRFERCRRYRLGATNDEGWFRGQCRYREVAPAWGEFYELTGEDPFLERPTDWRFVGEINGKPRHFLFYFRDETFECLAEDWRYELDPANKLRLPAFGK